jgi:hypothetical protein
MNPGGYPAAMAAFLQSASALPAGTYRKSLPITVGPCLAIQLSVNPENVIVLHLPHLPSTQAAHIVRTLQQWLTTMCDPASGFKTIQIHYSTGSVTVLSHVETAAVAAVISSSH